VRCGSSSFGNSSLRAARLAAALAWAIALSAGSSLAGPTGRAPTYASAAGAARDAAGWSREPLRAISRPHGVRVVEGSTGDARATVDALERAGYHVDVAVLPSTFFVRPRASHVALPAGLADVTPAVSEAPLAAAAPGLAGPVAPLAAPADPTDPFGGMGDALPPLARPPAPGPNGAPPMPSGLPQGAHWTDTSELMIGRVAVPILFPESDGSYDANVYDWTPALRDSVIRSATRGLLKWTAFAAAHDVPLTFLIEVHPSLPTGYEPITRTVAQEEDWIADALKPLASYGGDAEKEAYDVANAARARLGAHWAAIIFAVQNDTDPDGAFPDGFISHANLGGPWYVVPVNNLNTKSAALDYYMEHEMTHMFWALDENPSNSAWWSCTLTTGYFNWPNSNSAIPTYPGGYCGVDDRCLMKGNYPDSVCASTLGQVGWADRDLTGTLDLYETRPSVRTDSLQYGNFLGVPIHVAGTAGDVAFPNQNPFLFGAGDSITIATIDSLWYRVDGSAWTPLGSDDGVLDTGSERFSLTLNLPVGDHVVFFLARNSSGRTGLTPDSVVVVVTGSSGPPAVGSGGSPPAQVTAAPTPSRGPVHLSLRAAPGARATAEIFDAAGRRVRSWTMRLSDSGEAQWDWNGSGEGGAPLGSGVYFLRARWDGGALIRRLVLLR
jgi:flagellar hook capping protein FlgD